MTVYSILVSRGAELQCTDFEREADFHLVDAEGGAKFQCNGFCEFLCPLVGVKYERIERYLNMEENILRAMLLSNDPVSDVNNNLNIVCLSVYYHSHSQTDGQTDKHEN